MQSVTSGGLLNHQQQEITVPHYEVFNGSAIVHGCLIGNGSAAINGG
jgi:hypothetical protein